MTGDFDVDFWEEHWRAAAHGALSVSPPNSHLLREAADLPPGTALDAGCGAGAEAIWLATQGWQVTGVDLATEALERAAGRVPTEVTERLSWVQADLTTWEPEKQYDLVTTHYAHPTIPHLDFYARLGAWVAPGGTLFVVAHGSRAVAHRPLRVAHGLGVSCAGGSHDQDPDARVGRGHGLGGGNGGGVCGQSGLGDSESRERAQGAGHGVAQPTVTADAISSRFSPDHWAVVTATELDRLVARPDGRETVLHDVVVRLQRRPSR